MNQQKSTPSEIRERFDNDVERFSNLATGQSATVDAALAMTLVAQAAAASTPDATHILDVGCGAGNYSLKLLEQITNLNVHLLDLSLPMLERAKSRVSQVSSAEIITTQGDVRELEMEAGSVDVILAAAVLHHLRTDDEWEAVFKNFYRWLRPGGSIWIFDLIESSIPAVQELMWKRYGEYLADFKDEEYRDHVFEYIEIEDSPRPLMYQLDLLKNSGFSSVEVIHKNSCFAAFGALKAAE